MSIDSDEIGGEVGKCSSEQPYVCAWSTLTCYSSEKNSVRSDTISYADFNELLKVTLGGLKAFLD